MIQIKTMTNITKKGMIKNFCNWAWNEFKRPFTYPTLSNTEILRSFFGGIRKTVKSVFSFSRYPK
jgi:hypothetical protein